MSDMQGEGGGEVIWYDSEKGYRSSEVTTAAIFLFMPNHLRGRTDYVA
jgi:hypothetical protein